MNFLLAYSPSAYNSVVRLRSNLSMLALLKPATTARILLWEIWMVLVRKMLKILAVFFIGVLRAVSRWRYGKVVCTLAAGALAQSSRGIRTVAAVER